MTPRKTYGQFCGLARALDHIGDRWTLLVVRELLLGPRPYRDLLRALNGISPNLLTSRLQSLTEDGLVQRNNAPSRSKAVTFCLTDAGEALEPAVLALIRWGARWMASGPGEDRVESGWATLALRALLAGNASRPRTNGTVHVVASGAEITVETRGRRRTVLAGFHGTPDAHITASMSQVLAVAAGLIAPTELSGRGRNRALVQEALSP